jgi:hypothetical protein
MAKYNKFEDDYKKIRQTKLHKELIQPNQKNINTMKLIEKTDPKYARHMFLRNELIEQFAMHLGGGIDILEQPVCPHCERPAAWDQEGKGYCFSCKKSIPANKIVTVRQYLLEYTKGMSEEQLELLIGGENDDFIE